MIVVDFHIYRYSLPFVRPIFMLNQNLFARNGLLIKLIDSDGLEAFGDVPPFPGLSDETLELAFIQLAEICHRLKGQKFNVSHIKDVEQIVPQSGIYPSVRFGFESALMRLAARQQQKPLGQFLSAAFYPHVKTNGLISGPVEQWPQETRRLIKSGFQVIKIKVGRNEWQVEAEALQKLLPVFGKNVRLRLDANRTWDFDDAVGFAQAIKSVNVEYIEEPLADPARLVDFYRATGLPVALDESLAGDVITDPPQGVVAFIIKPGIHGGMLETIQLIKAARHLGVKPVLSSAFLSAVGLYTTACLAAAFAEPEEAMGLDTSSLLAKDFVKNPIKISGSTLDVIALEKNLAINSKLVTEISAMD